MNRDERRNTELIEKYPVKKFSRIDERPDPEFYARDRMVSHLDSRARQTVAELIGGLVTEPAPCILDLMASWDSHLPPGLQPGKMIGLGLNENELKANQALTDYLIHDLNAAPELPLADREFDAVLNVASVDYLIRPMEVFAEVGRVLKPGDLFLVIFSNRWFEPKVTEMWQFTPESRRPDLVRDWFRAADLFGPTEFFQSTGLPRPKDDKYAHLGIPSDPIYAVWAERLSEDGARPARKYAPGE